MSPWCIESIFFDGGAVTVVIHNQSSGERLSVKLYAHSLADIRKHLPLGLIEQLEPHVWPSEM